MIDYLTVPNRSVEDSTGRKFAYREIGIDTNNMPLVLLNHLSATLDNWDPNLINKLAANRKIIVFDNRGIGLSQGSVPQSITQMADDTVAFLKAMHYSKIDLLGLSMGGFVAQDFVLKYPTMVNKLILVGTGPKGDKKIAQVGRITNIDIVRSFFARKDVKEYLFFTTTAQGKKFAKEFISRLNKRNAIKDAPIKIPAYLNQLKAIRRYAHDQPSDLEKISAPTLIVNGDHDRMVPTQDSYLLQKKIKNSQLKIYPDAGHMSLFQNSTDFSQLVNEFLK